MIIDDRYKTPQWIQIDGGAPETYIGDPTSTVGTTAELEVSQTDSWVVGSGGTSNGIKLIAFNRIAYSHGGDEILYGYYRTLAFNNCGQLSSISAETRVTIDAPELCSTAG